MAMLRDSDRWDSNIICFPESGDIKVLDLISIILSAKKLNTIEVRSF